MEGMDEWGGKERVRWRREGMKKRGKGNAGEDSWGREGVELPRERACAR